MWQWSTVPTSPNNGQCRFEQQPAVLSNLSLMVQVGGRTGCGNYPQRWSCTCCHQFKIIKHQQILQQKQWQHLAVWKTHSPSLSAYSTASHCFTRIISLPMSQDKRTGENCWVIKAKAIGCGQQKVAVNVLFEINSHHRVFYLWHLTFNLYYCNRDEESPCFI